MRLPLIFLAVRCIKFADSIFYDFPYVTDLSCMALPLSTHKPCAIAALCKNSPPPAQTQNFPQEHPPPNKAKQIFAVYRRVLLGEVRGG